MTDAGPYRRSTSEPRVGRRRHRPTRSHAWLSSPRDTPCQSQAPTLPAETRPPSPGLRSLAPALPLPLPARESEWGLASARSLVSSLPSARAVPGPIYAEGERPYSRRMRSLLERRQMAAANRWSPGGTSTHAPATPDSPAPSMPGPRVRGPEGSPAVHIVAGPSAAHGRRSRDAPVAAPVLPRMPGAHDTARGAALPSNADAPRPLGPRTSPARQVTLSSLLDDALEVLAASSRVRPGEVGGEPGALGSVPDAVVGATGDREEPLWRDAATSVAGPTDEGVAGWGHHAWSSALRWLGWERGAVTGGPAGEHTVDGVERVGSGVGIRRGGEAKGGCEGANGTRDGAHLDRPLASEVPAVLGSRPFSPVRGGRAGDATPAGNTNPPLQRRLFGGGDWDGAGPVLPLTPRNVTAVWERVPGTVGDAVSDDEPLASVAGGHLSWTSPDVGPVPRDRRLGASDGRGEGQVEGSARARRVGVDLGGEGQEELLRRSLHGILDGLRSGGGHGGVGDRLGVESDAVGVTGSPERTGWPHVAAHVWRMRFVGAQDVRLHPRVTDAWKFLPWPVATAALRALLVRLCWALARTGGHPASSHLPLVWTAVGAVVALAPPLAGSALGHKDLALLSTAPGAQGRLARAALCIQHPVAQLAVAATIDTATAAAAVAATVAAVASRSGSALPGTLLSALPAPAAALGSLLAPTAALAQAVAAAGLAGPSAGSAGLAAVLCCIGTLVALAAPIPASLGGGERWVAPVVLALALAALSRAASHWSREHTSHLTPMTMGAVLRKFFESGECPRPADIHARLAAHPLTATMVGDTARVRIGVRPGPFQPFLHRYQLSLEAVFGPIRETRQSQASPSQYASPTRHGSASAASSPGRPAPADPCRYVVVLGRGEGGAPVADVVLHASTSSRDRAMAACHAHLALWMIATCARMDDGDVGAVPIQAWGAHGASLFEALLRVRDDCRLAVVPKMAVGAGGEADGVGASLGNGRGEEGWGDLGWSVLHEAGEWVRGWWGELCAALEEAGWAGLDTAEMGDFGWRAW